MPALPQLRVRSLWPALAGAALLADPALADDANAGSFDARLEAAFAELERSGLSAVVAVSHQGGSIVARDFGAASKDDIPAISTQVDVNSITKTVTGAMVMKLVEQKKVRVDERLGDLFRHVPPDKADITVHQLLTHSAGLAESVGPDPERLSKDELLARAFRSKLISAPGKKYHYSNVGFSVLAAIIELRSGKPYEAYLREELLSALSLPDTGYMSVYVSARSLLTKDGLPIKEASWGGHEPYWNLLGNGGLIATPGDFIRFRQAFAAGSIVRSALVDLAQTPHVAENSRGTSHYGYGLVVQRHPKLGTFYWHDGGNGVFSAKWIHYVDRGDILFTAAADTRQGSAPEALSILEKKLYGATSE